KAARADAERLHDGEIAANRGQASLVEVLEWGRGGLALQPARNQATDVAALLDRDLGNARETPPAFLQASRVSHDEDFRMRRDGAVGEHLDATCSVRLGTQPLCRRKTPHPRRPEHVAGPDPFAPHDDPSASTFSTGAPVRTST